MYKAVFGVLLLLIVSNSEVNAQGFGIEVSPTIVVLSSDSDSVYKIKVKNLENKPISLIPDFYSVKDAGSLDGRIQIENISEELEMSLKKNLLIRENQKLISIIELEPLETRLYQLEYQPNNQIANEKVFTLVLALNQSQIVVSEEKTSKSQIIPGVGILLIKSKFDNQQNTSIFDNFSSKSFYTKGPIILDTKLKNNSDNILHVRGNISIYNIINQKVAEIPLNELYMLPKSITKVLINGNTPSWNDSFLMGLYRSSLELEINGVKKTYNKYFFVIPILPLSVITFIIFFSLGVYLRVKRM